VESAMLDLDVVEQLEGLHVQIWMISEHEVQYA
jgi:hypothetical protein